MGWFWGCCVFCLLEEELVTFFSSFPILAAILATRSIGNPIALMLLATFCEEAGNWLKDRDDRVSLRLPVRTDVWRCVSTSMGLSNGNKWR